MRAALAGVLLAAAVGHAPQLPVPARGSSAERAARAGAPSSIDQEELQSYHTNLLDEQRALEREGVSPANPRYRDIQQQLLQLNNGSP